jgi:uncharacterized membrane protein
METKEINFKNWYLILLSLGGILFVILGIFLIFLPFFNDRLFPYPIVRIIIGIISILFFGFVTIIIFRKIFGRRPGLIINSTGIIDNSTGFSTKHIKWENIIGIKSFNIIVVKFIVVIINNPEEYFKRYKMGKLDYKMTGSPINIYTTVLKCKHKVLVDILQNELDSRK